MSADPSNKDHPMTILFNQTEVRAYSDVLDAWRAASERVRERWHQFRLADDRSVAFAAYVAALDHEEAAAAELALFTVDEAA